MVAACLIEECDGAGQSDDEGRRYYRITNHGKEVAAAEVDRMATLIAVARSKRLTTA